MIQLRPSSAHIWSKCDANPLMVSRIPQPPPTDPAREGTCAAWVAEMALTGQVDSVADMLGRSHDNGWLVTPDMVSHIAKYVEMVRAHGGQIHTERKVRLNPLIEGTPDAFAVLDSEGVLIADDLKYGYLPVEPYRNPQVSIYVGAILRYLHARDVVIRRVVIGIYQPRAWHPLGIYRTWKTDPVDLMAFVHELEARGPGTQVPNPIATPGEHCEYCAAAGTCHALAVANYRLYEGMAADTQRHMSETELAEELNFLAKAKAMLDGRETAVYAEAEARIKRGAHIPGYHMEERRGARRFKVPANVVKALTGVDPTDVKMVTPAELERRGAKPSIVAQLTEFPRINSALKPIPPGYFNALFAKKGQ